MATSSRETVSEQLEVISRVGILMLRSGAASFRVEDTMKRVAAALHVRSIGTFVTPSGMMVTLSDKGYTFTNTIKNTTLGVDMARITALEELTRKLSPDITVDELASQLDAVEHTSPVYPPLVVVVAVALACGAFAVILGGGILEFLAAAGGAATAQALRIRLVQAHLSPYLITTICAAVATTICNVGVLLMNVSHPRAALVASVLLLVPGVPFITALLDLMHLDLVSGISRGVYAALILMFLGLGMLLALAVARTGIL